MIKKQGLLISFEGGEGAGKTTQARKLVEKIAATGREVVAAREPGGTRIGEQIREVVLAVKNEEMTEETEALLYQAARAQIYGQVILPALAAGKTVVMDRTGDSSVVYQGMARGLGVAWIKQLNNFSMQGREPDLTFLLDVPAEIGLERVGCEQDLDRMEKAGLAFHEEVRAGYLALIDGERWRLIDATQTVEDIAEEVWKETELHMLYSTTCK